jgi:hypothetical protein
MPAHTTTSLTVLALLLTGTAGAAPAQTSTTRPGKETPDIQSGGVTRTEPGINPLLPRTPG